MELRQEGGGSGRWVCCWLAFLPPLPSAMRVGFEVPVFYICQPWATCFPALSFPHGYPFFSHSPFSLYSLCLSLFASLVGPCTNRPTNGIKHLNKKAGPFKCMTFSSSSLALLPRSEVWKLHYLFVWRFLLPRGDAVCITTL